MRIRLSTSYYKLESLVRGFANKRRIEILVFIDTHPECSVEEISNTLNIGYKLTSSHLLRLLRAGLIMKRQDHLAVRHALTKNGKRVIFFLKEIQQGNV